MCVSFWAGEKTLSRCFNRRELLVRRLSVKVIKALGNNMILCKDEQGRELICQGKGIGFQKRKGDPVDESGIERRFVPSSESESRHFQELFAEIPEEFWEIGEEVVQYSRTQYGLKVSDKVLLPICDHMAGCVERYRKGVVLANPMLWDIKRVYPNEFQIGLYALKLLGQRYGLEMKEDEAAFLAYHFVYAELENADGAVSPDEIARLISSVIDIVQGAYQVKLDETDWNYQRFITHLKFFAKRVLTKNGYEEPDENELYEELAGRYKHVDNCVELIVNFILIDYHYELSTDERLYLLIHIQRVTKSLRKRGKA